MDNEVLPYLATFVHLFLDTADWGRICRTRSNAGTTAGAITFNTKIKFQVCHAMTLGLGHLNQDTKFLS
jgi:hypothetical protein